MLVKMAVMSYYRKTVPEQIEHLKELGLIISDDAKAFEILSDIGFYRLGFYMFPFEKKYPAKVGRDHVVKEGISLDTVLRLYYFDFELRLMLLKYISRIEVHLRTTIVNYMSAKHHNKDTWFVDDAIVSANRLADLERELRQLIDKCKDNDALYTAIKIASGLK